jgi:hypothetical protein
MKRMQKKERPHSRLQKEERKKKAKWFGPETRWPLQSTGAVKREPEKISQKINFERKKGRASKRGQISRREKAGREGERGKTSQGAERESPAQHL